jgi:hypothetical protein
MTCRFMPANLLPGRLDQRRAATRYDQNSALITAWERGETATGGRPGRHEILDGVRARRMLSLIAAAVLAAVALTGCQTKVGLAASVNSVELTDSDLGSYVQPGAKPFRTSSGATIVQKTFALNTWLVAQNYVAAIDAHGGPATARENAGARAIELGTHQLSEVEAQFTQYGFTAQMGDLQLFELTRQVILAQRLLGNGASPSRAIAALKTNRVSATRVHRAIQKAAPAVTVSPRYGTWSTDDLALRSQPRDGLPTFVHVGTTQ